MAVPYAFQTATSAIPLANLDANFAYYDGAFSISGTTTQFLGNVGIGSASTANTRLTLSDTYSSKLILTGGSTQNGMLLDAISTASQYYIGAGKDLLVGADKGFLIYDVTNARAKFYIEDTTGETRTLGTSSLTYYTGGTIRQTIDSSGNVGIGTSTPQNKLNVVSADSTNIVGASTAGITITNTYTGAYGYSSDLIYSLGGGAGTKLAGISGIYTSGGGDLALYTYNGTTFAEKMRILGNGNVGIGTNAPSAKLTVVGTVKSASTTQSSFYLSNGAQTNGFLVGRSLGSSDTQDFFIYDTVAAATRLAINSSGIVTMAAYGAGAATFSATGVISSVSDETWKTKDGVPVDPDSMLKKLEPGYWYYNDEKKEIFGVDRQLGFYAQNVNAAIGPEAAPTPEEGKPWGYYDRAVLAVAVMSLQKALATIESLTARITALEST
jgi:hypothetical protein